MHLWLIFLYDYEHIAGCIRVVLKIRREYFHVALMTASLLSTILKTSRTQPMLLTTCGLIIAMYFYLNFLAVFRVIRSKKKLLNSAYKEVLC